MQRAIAHVCIFLACGTIVVFAFSACLNLVLLYIENMKPQMLGTLIDIKGTTINYYCTGPLNRNITIWIFTAALAPIQCYVNLMRLLEKGY